MIKTSQEVQPKPFFTSVLRWIGAVAVLTVFIFGGVALWKMRTRTLSQNGSKEVQTEDVQGLVKKVAQHLSVNEQETPLVAIVSDVNSARNQSPVFYEKAQNGDRLLVWSDKAVLYSPTLDVVESVLVFQTPSGGTTSTVASEKVTVEIRNGSGVTGVATVMAEKLRAQGMNVSKVTTTRVNKVYPTTLVMNASSRYLPASADVLVGYGSAVVSSTVPDEQPAVADFLIIVGKNDVAKYQP